MNGGGGVGGGVGVRGCGEGRPSARRVAAASLTDAVSCARGITTTWFEECSAAVSNATRQVRPFANRMKCLGGKTQTVDGTHRQTAIAVVLGTAPAACSSL